MHPAIFGRTTGPRRTNRTSLHQTQADSITLHDHDYPVRYMTRREQKAILSLATRKSADVRFYRRFTPT